MMSVLVYELVFQRLVCFAFLALHLGGASFLSTSLLVRCSFALNKCKDTIKRSWV
jgi:hypothetical protein